MRLEFLQNLCWFSSSCSKNAIAILSCFLLFNVEKFYLILEGIAQEMLLSCSIMLSSVVVLEYLLRIVGSESHTG